MSQRWHVIQLVAGKDKGFPIPGMMNSPEMLAGFPWRIGLYMHASVVNWLCVFSFHSHAISMPSHVHRQCMCFHAYFIYIYRHGTSTIGEVGSVCWDIQHFAVSYTHLNMKWCVELHVSRRIWIVSDMRRRRTPNLHWTFGEVKYRFQSVTSRLKYMYHMQRMRGRLIPQFCFNTWVNASSLYTHIQSRSIRRPSHSISAFLRVHARIDIFSLNFTRIWPTSTGKVVLVEASFYLRTDGISFPINIRVSKSPPWGLPLHSSVTFNISHPQRAPGDNVNAKRWDLFLTLHKYNSLKFLSLLGFEQRRRLCLDKALGPSRVSQGNIENRRELAGNDIDISVWGLETQATFVWTGQRWAVCAVEWYHAIKLIALFFQYGRQQIPMGLRYSETSLCALACNTDQCLIKGPQVKRFREGIFCIMVRYDTVLHSYSEVYRIRIMYTYDLRYLKKKISQIINHLRKLRCLS